MTVLDESRPLSILGAIQTLLRAVLIGDAGVTAQERFACFIKRENVSRSRALVADTSMMRCPRYLCPRYLSRYLCAVAFIGSFANVARADDAPRSWVGAGGRNTFGLRDPLDGDFGVYAYAGTWLVSEHVQPFVRLGWSRGPGDSHITIDTVRFGFGVGVGAALANGHLWLGGAAAIESVNVFQEAATSTSSQWLGMVSLSAIAQLRFAKRFLVGIEAGPDFMPAQLASPAGVLEWDVVRFTAGLRLGVILGASMH